ncbi:hypothetical protein LG293_15940 (plasmid) [Citricoccus nitrophenolicus]
MARKPKIYDGRGCFAGEAICQMLDMGDSARIADYYVMATTKDEAADLLRSVGQNLMRPEDLRVSKGSTARILAEAEVMASGDVLVVRPLTPGPVLRLRTETGLGKEIIGRTEFTPGNRHERMFIPTTPVPETEHQGA